jgi:hypothetical protein
MHPSTDHKWFLINLYFTQLKRELFDTMEQNYKKDEGDAELAERYY